MDVERELLRNQVLWIGRINALFAGCLGTLSGMSMLHIIILISISDVTQFLSFYAKFARNVNIIFLILVNLALILGIAMSMIYRLKAQEKMRSLDNERHSFRSQYTIAIVISIILSVCWVMFFFLPYWTIWIHYSDPATIENGVITKMRFVYGIANGLSIITFIIQQFASQQGPSDEELEPLSDDDGIDTSEEEDSEEETRLDDSTATQS